MFVFSFWERGEIIKIKWKRVVKVEIETKNVRLHVRHIEFLCYSFSPSSGKRNTRKKNRVVFRFTIKREIYERNAPKGVLLERFHSSGQQPCKFIQTPTWPPFCCIGTPKWRTWRNPLLGTLILLFFFIIIWRTSRYRRHRVFVSSLITWQPQVHCFIRCTFQLKNSMFVNSEYRFLFWR